MWSGECLVTLTYFLPEALILDIPEIDEQHQNLFADLADIKVGGCLQKTVCQKPLLRFDSDVIDSF